MQSRRLTVTPLESSGRTNPPQGRFPGETTIDAKVATATRLYRQGQHAAAAERCRALLDMPSPPWQAAHLLGVIALDAGDPATARSHLRQAARAGAAPALAALATAEHRLGNLDAAERAARAAVAAAPESAEVLFNLGNVLQRRHALRAAIIAYRRALVLAPDMVEIHVNLAMACLRQGALAEGWRQFEWRWRRPGAPQHFHRAAPHWDGGSCGDQTLLIHAEQGLGDVLQFCRFLPEVARRAGPACSVVVECPPSLLRLLRATFPSLSLVPKGMGATDRRSPVPPFQVQAALPSLPGLLGVTLETIPNRVPYLRCPADAPVPPGPLTGEGRGALLRVGVIWGGSSNFPARDVPAPALMACLDLPGVHLVSLQLGPHADAKPPGLADGGAWITACEGDFAATAALMQHLDLIVSVDTATAHLAGALGLPLALPLPHLPDWRWMLEREDSPWYPTARLFRQHQPGDWTDPLARLRTHVRGMRDARA